jgi:prevent-host-death family protein
MMKPKSPSPVVITTTDFRRNVSRTLQQVEAGQEVIITYKGKPSLVILSLDNYLAHHPEAREQIVDWALDEIGAELKQRGVTLESLMKSGRKVRRQMVKQEYGLGTKKVRKGHP